MSYSKIATVLTDKVTSLTKQFDSVLGISEVRSAQSLVQTAEDEFMKSRRCVGETRIELIRLQNQLRDLRSKLDRIPREDERYLQLATEEHKALIAERKAKTDLETLETLERDQFSALSAAVRAAHEKERSRAERTKYWSIIASACGAVLGILGSTIINMKRMKQIRLTVQENNEEFIAKTMEELGTLFKPGQHEITTSGVGQAHSQLSNDFLALLNENTKMLGAIDAKVENRHIRDLAWWSKASLIASVTSSACLIFYMLSK
ncbi:Hypothetical predicted protein [Paramuricea clavata]|nr:Hypothetical predicted protein [Paramuricea clavata]